MFPKENQTAQDKVLHNKLTKHICKVFYIHMLYIYQNF